MSLKGGRWAGMGTKGTPLLPAVDGICSAVLLGRSSYVCLRLMSTSNFCFVSVRPNLVSVNASTADPEADLWVQVCVLGSLCRC